MNVHKRHSRSSVAEMANTKTAFVAHGPKELIHANKLFRASRSMFVETGNRIFATESK